MTSVAHFKRPKLLVMTAIGLSLVLVTGFLAWAFVLPKLNAKTANEQLSDIVAQPMRPQSPQPKAMSESAMPPAPAPTNIPAPAPTAVPTPAPPAVAPSPALEPAADPNAPQVIRGGSFRGVEGESGSGTASIVKAGDVYYLRLEQNFTVTNGPDLYVGFGNGGQVDKSTLFARLKANSGGQNYEIPASIAQSNYGQVFIYCKAFSHAFAIADL